MLPSNTRPLARIVLLSLLLTFITARLVSILMLLPHVPDIYLHVHETHIHHLNYGIFLLAGVGAYLLFSPGPPTPAAAVIYGIGLGLTFDEFGMWLHLDDVYWQRASFDAMVLIAAILGLVMAAPTVRRFRLRHWVWTTVITLAVVWFTMLLMSPFQRMHQRIAPWFRNRTQAADSAALFPPAGTLPDGQPPAGPSQRIRK